MESRESAEQSRVSQHRHEYQQKMTRAVGSQRGERCRAALPCACQPFGAVGQSACCAVQSRIIDAPYYSFVTARLQDLASSQGVSEKFKTRLEQQVDNAHIQISTQNGIVFLRQALMRFRYTIFYVESVPATLAFFENAFGIELGFLHESEDYGELLTGDTKLAFSSIELMKSLGKDAHLGNPHKPVCEIALETDDVASALERALEAGATLVKPLEEMPWGQTIAYVHEANGILVELCTPVAQA